jgi:hypothetical protein
MKIDTHEENYFHGIINVNKYTKITKCPPGSNITLCVLRKLI